MKIVERAAATIEFARYGLSQKASLFKASNIQEGVLYHSESTEETTRFHVVTKITKNIINVETDSSLLQTFSSQSTLFWTARKADLVYSQGISGVVAIGSLVAAFSLSGCIVITSAACMAIVSIAVLYLCQVRKKEAELQLQQIKSYNPTLPSAFQGIRKRYHELLTDSQIEHAFDVIISNPKAFTFYERHIFYKLWYDYFFLKKFQDPKKTISSPKPYEQLTQEDIAYFFDKNPFNEKVIDILIKEPPDLSSLDAETRQIASEARKTLTKTSKNWYQVLYSIHSPADKDPQNRTYLLNRILYAPSRSFISDKDSQSAYKNYQSCLYFFLRAHAMNNRELSVEEKAFLEKDIETQMRLLKGLHDYAALFPLAGIELKE